MVCEHVGEGNAWAYRHNSSEARSQLAGKDRGQVYSIHPGDYVVMCRRHHTRFDRAHARTTPLGTLSLAHVALAEAFTPDYDAWKKDQHGQTC